MNHCDVCGKPLMLGANRLMVGVKYYCGPEGSDCHRIGLRNQTWRLSVQQAAELLEQLFDEAS